MSFVDHEGSVEYPFSINTVFDAIKKAISKIDGFETERADKLSGRITLKAGVSLMSWGENISIQLTTIAPTRTLMRIMSSPKTGAMFGGAMDGGKNRRNIDKIINAVSDILATKPVEQDSTIQSTPIASVADELIKLKQLLDQGVLTQEEFDIQKQKVLANDVQVSPKPSPAISKVNIEKVPIQKENNKFEKDDTDSNMWIWLLIVIAIIIAIMLIAIHR